MFRDLVSEKPNGSFDPGPIAYRPLPLDLRQAVNAQNYREVHLGPQFVGCHPS
jgi:hypothetical protein